MSKKHVAQMYFPIIPDSTGGCGFVLMFSIYKHFQRDIPKLIRKSGAQIEQKTAINQKRDQTCLDQPANFRTDMYWLKHFQTNRPTNPKYLQVLLGQHLKHPLVKIPNLHIFNEEPPPPRSATLSSENDARANSPKPGQGVATTKAVLKEDFPSP